MAIIKLSIAIPCYNEQQNIPRLLDRVGNSINRDDVECIFVNNGSTDGTGRVLSELAPRYHFARHLDITPNRGYGGGILTGLAVARGEYLGWTHADLQTDPLDAVRALRIIEDRGNPSNIYVKGSRTGRSGYDNLFTLGMSVLETVYLRVPLWDINAQPNVFHRSFYESWKGPPVDFSLDLYALYMARRLRLDIVRFDVAFLKRAHGTSSWNTGIAGKWKFIMRALSSSIDMKNTMRAFPPQKNL